MKVTAERFEGQRGVNYNVNLASKEGQDPFLSIKSVQRKQTKDGKDFVAYPQQKTDKGYWKHVWGSDKFNDAVLAAMDEADKDAPKATKKQGPAIDESDIPF